MPHADTSSLCCSHNSRSRPARCARCPFVSSLRYAALIAAGAGLHGSHAAHSSHVSAMPHAGEVEVSDAVLRRSRGRRVYRSKFGFLEPVPTSLTQSVPSNLQEPADVRLHARLGASGNRFTSGTTWRGRSTSTLYHVSQEFVLTAKK
jgi:hypothetical protein